MAPFVPPNVILSGFKERIESLLVQGMCKHLCTSAYRANTLVLSGDKLYIGTAIGNLHIYVLHNGESSTLLETIPLCRFGVSNSLSETGDGERRAELLETKKALSRRAIEHLGFVQDISSLAVLTGTSHPRSAA